MKLYNARNKIDNITNENVYTTKKFSNETLIGEKKLVVMSDKAGGI